MSKRIVDVICLEQDGHQLLLTALTAHDLVQCTTIDRYNHELPAVDPDQGYQRPEEIVRAKKLAKHLHNVQAIMPTAILLSARDVDLCLDTEKRTIVIDSDQPLQLVDGQHRVAGLRYAMDDQRQMHLLNYQIPVVIMLGLDKIAEMQQFQIVNGTQKSVRTDLVHMILSQIAAAQGEDAIAATDRWKVVVSRAIEYLNGNANSVWYDKVIMPDETAPKKSEIQEDPSLADRKIIRATSFMTSLKRLYDYLVEYSLIPSSWNVDQQAAELARIVSEYWNALRQLCPEVFDSPKNHVIQKTPGVFSLHMVCRALIKAMHTGRRALVEDEFAFMMKPALEGPSEVLTEAYWRTPGGPASAYGSMKGFTELAEIVAGEMGVDL